MKCEDCKRLLGICKRLLEDCLEMNEEEFSRKREYMLSEGCYFTLYRKADLLIKEIEKKKE